MLEYEEARDRLLADLAPGPARWRPTRDFASVPGPCFLAGDLFSTGALPPADNSSMDGYAVRALDTATVPALLEVVGHIAAGSVSPISLAPGQAMRIFTGAPLPRGADAVVMQEDTETDPAGPGKVRILDPVKPWENVRFAGEDVKAGLKIAMMGDLLTPGRLALIAALGIPSIPFHSAPRVALLGTGSELSAGGVPLLPGQIHESNLLPLQILVRAAGGLPVLAETVRDDPALTLAAIQRAAGCADVVLTIGGASVGDHDLVKAAAIEAGFTIDFWKVSLKPGKPFFRGRRGEVHLFGVPGNPVSAFVTTVLLVQPALRRLAGATDPLPPTVPGILAAPLSNPDGRRHFMRVTLARDGTVRSAGIQASHILGSLAQADGLVDVPPSFVLPEGAHVTVILW